MLAIDPRPTEMMPNQCYDMLNIFVLRAHRRRRRGAGPRAGDFLCHACAQSLIAQRDKRKRHNSSKHRLTTYMHACMRAADPRELRRLGRPQKCQPAHTTIASDRGGAGQCCVWLYPFEMCANQQNFCLRHTHTIISHTTRSADNRTRPCRMCIFM